MQLQNKIYVFFGLIASGKSTLAEAWAEHIDAAYYNSDRVRKELAGLLPQSDQKTEFNQGIYTKEFSRKTYDALLENGSKHLTAGNSLVLDASYQEESERLLVKQLADKYNCKILFVFCQCPEDVMKERMALRAKDPNAVSDGRWEIYLQQKKRFRHPTDLAMDELITINTDKPVNMLVNQLESMVKE